ncbi:endonuclease [Lysinibacillus sp. 54212]|uniref:endonuclease n=1 Tax=Lysinibacillus sp. 54212 TaxID=3119829 RepID=UPI002FC687EA
MKKIQLLLERLSCLDAMLGERILLEQAQVKVSFYEQLNSAHQRVSLAEKKWQVKNTCSPKGSERD